MNQGSCAANPKIASTVNKPPSTDALLPKCAVNSRQSWLDHERSETSK